MSVGRRRARVTSTAAPVVAAAPARFGPAPLVFSAPALSAVKWLALALMVVDHTNKYVFDGSVSWMYALGRLSMPLFAFVLGYNLARPGLPENGGYRRVALRLAGFGLLATVPFVAVNQLPSGWWPLNMMFTLLVATLVAWMLDRGGRGPSVAAWLVLVWGGALVEYWWPALGLALCVWAYRRRPTWGLVAGFLVCLMLLYFVNGNFWALSVLPVLALLQRWPLRLPRAQWLFYAFYPVHLALFWLLTGLH